jgi:hypothetical protein
MSDLSVWEKIRVHISILALATSHQLVRACASTLSWLMDARLRLRIKAQSKLMSYSFVTNQDPTTSLRDALCQAILGEYSTYYSMITRRGVVRLSPLHTLSDVAPSSGQVVVMPRRPRPATTTGTTFKKSPAQDKLENAQNDTSHRYFRGSLGRPLSPSEKNRLRLWQEEASGSGITEEAFSNPGPLRIVKSVKEPEE